MDSKSIKSELANLIDREQDADVLNAIYILLKRASAEEVTKELMTKRALRSEEDIKNGRVMDQDTFESKLKQRLGI